MTANQPDILEDRAPILGGLGARQEAGADVPPPPPVSRDTPTEDIRGDAEYRTRDMRQADSLWDVVPEEEDEVDDAPSREVGVTRTLEDRAWWTARKAQWVARQRVWPDRLVARLARGSSAHDLGELYDYLVDEMFDTYRRLLVELPVAKPEAGRYAGLERRVDTLTAALVPELQRAWPPQHWQGGLGFAHAPTGFGLNPASIDALRGGEDDDTDRNLLNIPGTRSLTDRNVEADRETADSIESESLNEGYHDVRRQVTAWKLIHAYERGALPERDLVWFLEYLGAYEPGWPEMEAGFRVCAYDGCDTRVYAFTPAEFAKRLGVTETGGRPRAYCSTHVGVARREAARARAAKHREKTVIRLYKRA